MGMIKTYMGPSSLHINPPIIGAGIVTKPVNRPSSPPHLPCCSSGRSSRVMALVAPAEMEKKAKRAADNTSPIGPGEKARNRLEAYHSGVSA